MPDRDPSPEAPHPLVALRRRRQEVIDRLTDDFARDLIDVDEFEQRIERAHRADSLEALDRVVTDLAPSRPAEPAPSAALEPRRADLPAAAEPAGQRKRRWMVAVMSGVRRQGSWQATRNMKLVCLMGGAEIDFRDVSLPPGQTDLSITCVMGGAEIIVPPDLHVECEGLGIMGGIDHVNQGATGPAQPDAPILRIRGLALMGGISVSTRLPGESQGDARRRQRRERRALAEERRRQLASGGGGD